MKLVEITDVYDGQVWKAGQKLYVIKIVNVCECADRYINGKKVNECLLFEEGWRDVYNIKLIGKLGLTHEVKDGKLVKIEREHPCIGCIYENKELGGYYMPFGMADDNCEYCGTSMGLLTIDDSGFIYPTDDCDYNCIGFYNATHTLEIDNE